MADATRVSAARSSLWDVLRNALDPTPWRAHKYPPAQVVAPCIFIGTTPDLAQDVRGTPGATFTIATFPITAVFDGADERQVAGLDDMQCLVWDAVLAVGANPRSATPGRLNVGGPTLRSVVIDAEFVLLATTLCIPLLEATHV